MGEILVMEKEHWLKMETQDNKPIKLPDAWPSDGRSKLACIIGQGWVLHHPDRDTMIYQDCKWKVLKEKRKTA